MGKYGKSIRLYEEVAFDDKLTAIEKLLFSYIVDATENRGGLKLSSVAIGKLINLKERQVRKYLKDLEDKGYIVTEFESKFRTIKSTKKYY